MLAQRRRAVSRAAVADLTRLTAGFAPHVNRSQAARVDDAEGQAVPTWRPDVVTDLITRGVVDLLQRLVVERVHPDAPVLVRERNALAVGGPLRCVPHGAAAIGEIFTLGLVPQMFAQVAQDKMTPQEAAKAMDRQFKTIFKKWRDQGLVP